MKAVAMLSVIVLLAASSGIAMEDSVSVRHPDAREFIVKTADGLELHAWMTPSSTEQPAPLYVLLPMMAHTHESYDPFVKALYERIGQADSTRVPLAAPHILRLDLRGHGKSVRRNDSAVSFRSLSPQEFRKYPSDIEAMLERVLADKSARIDRDKIVVIGASIGANSAIMLTGLVNDITKVVMLSPGENYRSLEPAKAVKGFQNDILILVGEQDNYSGRSSEKLAALNKKRCRLKVYPGPDHGTDIINNNAQAMAELIDWLLK